MDINEKKHKIRRYLNDTYTMADTEEVHENLSNIVQHRETFDELAAEVWEEANHHVHPHQHEEELYSEGQQFLRRLKKRHRFIFRKTLRLTVGIAASLIFVLSTIYIYSYYTEKDVVLTQMQTTFGEKKNIILSDGSHVILNSCSRLEYPEHFVDDQRIVSLEGEAYFQIAHNEKQPFLVKTGSLDVKVLGTEFNVKSYKEDDIVSVAVNSGKVQVSLPEAVLRLKPKEKILVNTSSGEFNKKRGIDKVAQWRKGCFCFNSTPIQDVVRDLERTFNCDIDFQENQIFDNLITGEHDSQNLQSILESLRYVSGINYKKAGKKIILYK